MLLASFYLTGELSNVAVRCDMILQELDFGKSVAA